ALPASAPPSVLFVLQPETPPSRTDFAEVLSHGGTVVLAGDSVGTIVYARSLGVTFELSPASGSTLRTPDNALVLDTATRFRIRGSNATPLLLGANGDVVAARLAYDGGDVVLIATPGVLSNAGLRDDDTARFVFRELLASGVTGVTVGFDEVHHSFAPTDSTQVSLDQLLFGSAAGRAILYAALLTFGFIVLTGRRLGPPLPARSAAESRRTMYEHVQMLAGLYRRAGQFAAARSAFVNHYARRANVPAVVERIEGAQSEAELIAAVAAADDSS
ncbi:MAG: hypothetical protein JOY61_18440, partial [Chloroflexi bacterium]|nr:hypothetical protein [Chloroflexota bacterium]